MLVSIKVDFVKYHAALYRGGCFHRIYEILLEPTKEIQKEFPNVLTFYQIIVQRRAKQMFLKKTSNLPKNRLLVLTGEIQI